jgi:ABC-type transport system involved in Fe-S cluster assembly fused permease/ATPase subunit
MGTFESASLSIHFMALSAPDWQFILMTVFGLLAAHLVAAGILNWSISARRQRSAVRQKAKKRAVQRLARLTAERPLSP